MVLNEFLVDSIKRERQRERDNLLFKDIKSCRQNSIIIILTLKLTLKREHMTS